MDQEQIKTLTDALGLVTDALTEGELASIAVVTVDYQGQTRVCYDFDHINLIAEMALKAGLGMLSENVSQDYAERLHTEDQPE